ncbi:MAG: hypothetical protein N3B18_11775 [Desulfobacterota bacterium]|nr:hypothetical protein [Thermodesulfobacteriota bacterium]
MEHSIRVFVMHRFAVFFFALIAIALSVCGAAQAAPSASVAFQYNLGGSARYGMIDGNTMYSLIGGRLYIADVSNIANPVEQGSLPTPGIGRRISKKDNVLYLACTEGGMVTVDVSDPQNPKQLAQLIFDTPDRLGKTFDVVVRGNYAYVADHTGLHTVDITNPAAPVLKTSFTDFSNPRHLAYDLMLDGNYAYLCCEGDGLYIFDISNPGNPAYVSQWKDSVNNYGQFYQSARSGNYLYVAGGIRGIVVLDVSDVKNPKLVSNFVGGQGEWGGAIGLVNVGTYCYVQDEFFNMHYIDVSDPIHPVETGSFNTEGHHSLGIWNDGSRILLANATYGVRIFDAAGNRVTQRGAFRSPGRVMGCAGAGNYAYLAAGENGLKIYDVGNPAKPVPISSLALDAFANGIYIDGRYAYIAGLLGAGEKESEGGLLEIVDVQNPANPGIAGQVELTGQPNSVVVKNGIAYVATQTNGVAIVDVSDPANPAVLSTYDTLGLCYGIDLLGGFLVGADGLDGIVILDIRDTAYPKKLFNCPLIANVLNATVWDTYAYFAGGSNGLMVADLAIPFAPAAVTVIDPLTLRNQPGQTKASTAFNSYLLTVETIGNLGRVRLFDLQDAGYPYELAGDAYLLGDPLKLSFSSDQGLAYVSSQIAGLYIYAVDITGEPGIDLDGRWLGAAEETGIALELDQAHDVVRGSIILAGTQTETATLSGTISEKTFTATVQPSGTLSLTLQGDGTLAGTINGASAVLHKIGSREFPTLKNAATVLRDSIVDTKESAAAGQRMFLNIAEKALAKSLASEDTSSALNHAAVVEAALGMSDITVQVAAAYEYLYPAAYGEAQLAQAASQIMATEICADYQRQLSFFDTLGDNAIARGAALAARKPLAMQQYSAAVRSYEKVFALYRQNKSNCPTFGYSEFDGYYEGGIDFGLVQAKVRACVLQADNGTVTGEFYIIVESTGEYLKGVFGPDCINTGETESVITGTILVTVGEITAHLLIQDWKYNTVSQKWEGSLRVVEQDVTGRVSLGKLQDVCPEGWDVIK